MIPLLQFFSKLKFKSPFGRELPPAAFLSPEGLHAEADRDLARRSTAGVSSYFLLWLIIYFTSDLEKLHAVLLEFIGFILAALVVGRLYVALSFHSLYAASPRRWRLLFAIGTILSAAMWGGFCVLALKFDGLGATSVMILLSTAGIAAGGIVSLAPAARLGGFFVGILLISIVPSTFISGLRPEKGIALLSLAFFIYMFFLSRRLHVEYRSSLAGRAELVRAKEAAEAATIAKGQFIASVTHELRTPLTTIIGALGMIESYPPEGMPEQAKTLVGMAYLNGKRLSRLINDLLDFEKLDARRMVVRCQPMALTPVLKHALELNLSYDESRRVSFVLEEPPVELWVSADEQRLLQVMTNLLSNAAKHSRDNERVLIRVSHGEGVARVSVIDRGAGVPEDFREHIFEEFAQAQSDSTGKTQGTGLGLAISKAIIEQMGGTIGFDSEVGRGATFYFNLPMAKKP